MNVRFQVRCPVCNDDIPTGYTIDCCGIDSMGEGRFEVRFFCSECNQPQMVRMKQSELNQINMTMFDEDAAYAAVQTPSAPTITPKHASIVEPSGKIELTPQDNKFLKALKIAANEES